MLVYSNSEQECRMRDILNENPETRDADVEYIKDWLKSQPHLPDQWDENILLSFLRGCKFSKELTKKKLETYFTYRTIYPEFFSNRDIRSPELQAVSEIFDAAILPDLTPEGCRVSVARAAKTNFDTPNMNDLIKVIFMGGDLRLKLEKFGVCDVYVADVNFPIAKHFFKVNPMTLKKMFMCVQNAYPVVMREIHIVNAPSYIEFVLSIIRPFMNEHLRNSLHVHSSIETLYEFVPREILPVEFGGSKGQLKKLKEKWMEFMKEEQEWFEEQEMIKADLTKKRKTNKIEDVEIVNIKTLCID